MNKRLLTYLLKLCGHYTLAIRIACAYGVRTTNSSIATYVS